MAEYIEKDKVLGLLHYNCDEACSAVVAEIESIPSADVAPVRWISVDERLPQTDGRATHDYDVLCYVPKRDGCHQNGCYLGKLTPVKADDGNKNFWGLRTEASEWTLWGWSYFEHPVVTHWMPLPEPPEED